MQSLSSAERERRWVDYVASQSNGRKQSKQTNKAAIRVNNPTLQTKGNEYLGALLDPEGKGRGVGVPDEFCSPTFKFQEITVQEMKYQGNNFAVAVHPTAKGHLCFADDTVNALNYSWTKLQNGGAISAQVVTSSNLQMQEDMDRGILNDNVALAQIADGVVVSFPSGKPIELDEGLPCPYRYIGPADGYGIFISSAGDVTISGIVRTRTNAGAGSGATPALWVRAFDMNGNYLGTQNIVSSSVRLGTSKNATPVTTNFIDGYVWSMGWADMSDAFSPATAGWVVLGGISNSAWEGQDVESIEFNFAVSNITTAYAPILPVLTNSVDVSDYSNNAFTEFINIRPVSMSALATYFGNMLDNAMIASKLVFTDEDVGAFPESLLSYQSLAQRPQSFNGSLQKGTYCVWKPTTIQQATKWDRPQRRRTQLYDHPYIIITGRVPEAAAKSIRLRTIINFEAQTNSTIYGASPTMYSPTTLHDTFVALAYVQPCMENESHLRAIADALARVGISAFNAFKSPAAGIIGNFVGGPAVGRAAGAVAAAIPNLVYSNGTVRIATQQ